MVLASTAVAPAPSTGITTTIIGDGQALLDLRPEWNALVQESASSTPFLTWEWLQGWWSHLRGSASLNVIAVRSRSELIGIAPLLAARRSLPFSSSLEFLGTGHAGSDYLDLIIRKGREREAVGAMASVLESQQLALRLDHLPPSPLAEQLRQELTASGWAAIESSPDVCPVIKLAGLSWESYLSTLGASHRANVRRRLRQLNAAFDVTFALAGSHEERRAGLDALMSFHDRRWDDCGGSTAFCTSSLRAFHSHVTRQAFDAGWLRLYTLSLNGAIAAAMYGFLWNGRFYFYQHGFSAAYADHSAGLVLMALSIRAAIDEGAAEFDMLYGHEAYKKLWAREERPLGRLQLFPPHFGGNLLRRQAETRQALRTFAHQLGLKSRHGHA